MLAQPAFASSVEAKVVIGSEERVSPRIMEVTVEGKKRDSRNEVMDEALYKAARKTLKNDYDWFRILDREIEKETEVTRRGSGFSGSYERVPERSCGLLGCTTRYRTEYNNEFNVRMNEREDTVYTITLEYQMGTGPTRGDTDVYDARIVKNSFK